MKVLVPLSFLLLACLAAFQLALALGAPLGEAAWGGNHDELPTRLRIGSAASILVYGAAAAVLWVRRRDANSRLAHIGAWVFGILFLLSGVVNLASSSEWERFLLAPVSLVLATTFLLSAARVSAATHDSQMVIFVGRR
jgi:hypothetical protein